ncbi:STAS domain-containing protein [Anaerococcus sp. mt242]|uniref:STAS domain-containing protein n=1 Tax=Anaerococcus sp. mt242 TaxID=2661917 RepID=UPI0019345A2D|nr:STAS domain-containing protein [Anaerococcus sp. mt242]MBM0046209.1 STAS domain-containing protein [Anaerococcus sp. mt242]
MFDKKLETTDEIQTIKLIGDLDVYSEDEFKSFIDEKIDPNKDVTIDLNELDYLDSTGLGMFMNIYKMVNDNGKEIKIINAKDNIQKLFKITDLTDLFDME